VPLLPQVSRDFNSRVRLPSGRYSWSLVDQVLSSGTNFAVAVVLARVLGPEGLGSFTIAFATWIVILGLVRAAVIQPFVVGAATASGEFRAREVSNAADAILLVTVLLAILVIAPIGFVVGPESQTGEAILTLAALAPALGLQDFFRFAAFAKNDPKEAATNDGIWAIVQIAVLTLLWGLDALTTVSALCAWGLGAVGGCVYGSCRNSVKPLPRPKAVRWLRRHVVVGSAFLAAELVYAAGSQGTLLVIAGQLGNAATGGLRSVGNLFAPAQLVMMSAAAVGLPSAARAAARGSAALLGFARRWSGILSLLCACYSAVILLLGAGFLSFVFGEQFRQYSDILVPIAVATCLAPVALGAELSLKGALRAKPLLAVQFVAAPLRVLAVATLGSIYGIKGASWGLAIGAGAQAAGVWIALATSGTSERVVEPS